MNTLKFWGEVVVMSPYGGGHSPRMRGGSGVKALSHFFSDESLSYSLKTHLYEGALTSYFTE